MCDLVGNPEDRFSQNEAHIKHHFNIPMQCTVILRAVKNDKSQMKIVCVFSYICSKHRLLVHKAVQMGTNNLCFPAQNIDCGYSLEPP